MTIALSVEKILELLFEFVVFKFIIDVYLGTLKEKDYMQQTIAEYDSIIKKCEDIFAKKMKDYGSAWRILRISSLTDQIFIKAQRIRSIEDKGLQKVDEGVVSEFIGIVNYSIIGLIQLELGVAEQEEEIQYDQVMNLFDKYAIKAKKLMLDKNHDYGEAWREMRVSSLTDLILQNQYYVHKKYKK